MVDIFKNGSHRRILRGILRNLIPDARSWALSVGVLCCCVAALGQSQEQSQDSSTTPATEAGAPAEPAQSDPSPPAAGSISGTVLDESGAVVVGARLTLTHEDQSPAQEAVSGEYGQYSFTAVAPGNFQIKVVAAGFATRTSSGVLNSGEVHLVPPIALAVAASSTEIHVTASRIEIAQAQIQQQEKQRVLGFFPNFYVSYAADAVPLTSKQKFELATKTMIDPVTFALTGIGAGVQQAQNDFGGYGQGAQGYAKRFAASYVDNATSTFIGSAILPSLLKQDPRYFYKGAGSVKSRLWYAIANAVICKGDNQRWQFNYSAVVGGLASGAISNLYYPPNDRGAALIFKDTAIGTAQTAVFNVLQEFLLKKFTPHAPKQDPTHP